VLERLPALQLQLLLLLVLVRQERAVSLRCSNAPASSGG
jgi:hypothetical protein